MGEAIRDNPGCRDFEYQYRDYKIPVLENSSGCRDVKIMVLEKNPGYRNFKSSTENRVESLYNRENFPGASPIQNPYRCPTRRSKPSVLLAKFDVQP